MNSFSRHFTYGRLLRYSLSPIVMMIFTSVYGVVDGLFLSNFVDKTAFAAVNFVIPFLMLLSGIGFMFGTGGSALMAKVLGQGNHQKANEIFSSLYLVSFLTGILLVLLGQLLLKPFCVLLGAQGQLLRDSLIYGRIYLLGLPACILQFESENFYSAAGKPKLGLIATVSSGCTNILLDYLFIVVFSWGLWGAAAATILSQCLSAFISFFYFRSHNSSYLHLKKASPDWYAMKQICFNGLSEVVNNVSINTVSMLYNVQLLRYVGNDGVAAYGILMSVNFMFTAVFWGYIVGVSPLISFQYGAQNAKELRSLLRKSLVLVSLASAVMFVAAETLAHPISVLFVGYDPRLLELTLRGFLMFSFNFLFAGLSIFSASFFTALNNGFVSAMLSFLRTFFFQVLFILVLPLIWQVDGIWLALVAAELFSAAVGGITLLRYRQRYQY